MNKIYDFSNKQIIKRDQVFSDLDPKFSFLPGDIHLKTHLDYDAIKSGIRNIFDYYLGQRILYPNFGNRLYKLLYTPINNITAENIRETVKAMILDWEPRIEIQDIKVIPDEDNNQYDVNLIYRVKVLEEANRVENFKIKGLNNA